MSAAASAVPVGLSTAHIWPQSSETVQKHPLSGAVRYWNDVTNNWNRVTMGAAAHDPRRAPVALQVITPAGKSAAEHDRTRNTLVFAVNAASVMLAMARTQVERVAGGIRGEVCGFSWASRRRFLHRVMSIDQQLVTSQRVVFVTLTYPGQYSTDRNRWKRDLQTWRKRWARKFGIPVGFWKLEFQKRGAPHFHLLLLVDAMDREQLEACRKWVSESWYKVVGSGDERHLRVGTNVQTVRSWQEVAHYAGKYLGKTQTVQSDEGTGEVKAIGRVWGAWNDTPGNIPRQYFGVELLRDEAMMIRRALTRLVGRRKRGKVQNVICHAKDTTAARLIEWAMVECTTRRANAPAPCLC